MKKAITPLISTILLLIFAIGLGSLVISWGDSQVIGGCQEVEMQITSLNNYKQLCSIEGNIQALLENNGQTFLKDIRIITLYTDNVESNDYMASIKPGSFQRFNFFVDDISEVLKIRLIPFNGDTLCTEKRVEFENIGDCNEP